MTQLLKSGLLLDLIVLVVLLLDMTLGARRGFVRTLYRGCKVIVSAAVAFFFAKPLASLLRDTPFYKGLLTHIEKAVGGYFSAALQNVTDSASVTFSDGMNAFLSVLGHTPEEIREQYGRMLAEKGEDAAGALVEYVVTPACESILNALCFIALFFVTALLLFLIMKLLNLVASAPVLNGANRALGLLAGIVIAVLHILLFCMIFDAVLPYLEGLQIGPDSECVKNARLYGFFDAFNPFRLTAM